MGVRIDSNNPAIQATTTQTAQSRLTRGLDRLSTALRPSAGQQSGASGAVALADKLRTQILQYTEQANNLQSAVSIVQTADKAMEAQAKGLAQLRDLATQAADTTLTADQRTALNTEAQKAVSQLDQTAKDTKFGGQALLDGSTRTVTTGGRGGPSVNMTESTAASLGVNKIDLTTAEGATTALAAVDNAQVRVGQGRAALQTQADRLTQTIEQRRGAQNGVAALQDRLDNVNAAQQAIEQARAQFAQNATATQAQGVPSTSLVSRLLAR